MFKIGNQVYKNENVQYSIGSMHTKKTNIKVVDLLISYEEEEKTKKHCFESFEYLEYLKSLKVDAIIERQGISDYLYYENNDLVENGVDLDYKVDIIPDEDVFVRCKRIDKERIIVNIIIDKIKLFCEEIINISFEEED